MEPFSMAAMTAVGIGFQAFGGMSSYNASKDYNAANQQKLELEKQQNAQRKLAMELDARRKSTENLRKTQQMAAVGQANASAQGAMFSSGYAGGQSQVKSQGAWNEAGISQNLQIGEKMFGIQDQMTNANIQMANAQQGMQQGQGISSFGSSLMGSAGAFGRLTSGPGQNRTLT